MPGKEVNAVEAVCPKCGRTEIVYLPKEHMPRCPKCNVSLVLKDILTEGKAY